VGYGAMVITLGFILLYLPVSPSGLEWPHEWIIVLAWAGLGLVAYAVSKRVHPQVDRTEQERIILGEYARGAAKSR